MKMRQKEFVHARRLLVLLCFILLLSGCSDGGTDYTEPNLDGLVWYDTRQVKDFAGLEYDAVSSCECLWIYGEHVTEQGRFRYSQERQQLEFCDWEKREVYPLCAKTNCTHDDDTCNAFFSLDKDSPLAIYCYDGSVYFLFNEDGEKTCLYRQNLDGTDRKTVFSVNEFLHSNFVLYSEQTVIFTTLGLGEDDAADPVSDYIYHIYVGDILTGEVRALPLEFTGKLIDIELWGLYGDQLIFSHAVTETSGKRPGTKSTVYQYDLATETLTGIETDLLSEQTFFAVDMIADGVCAYTVFDSQTAADGTAYGSTLSLINIREQCVYRVPVENGIAVLKGAYDDKVFYERIGEAGMTESVVLDLLTGQVTVLPEQCAALILDGEAGDLFYGRFVSEAGELLPFHILKSDYYSGNDALEIED